MLTNEASDSLLWVEGTALTPQHFQYWEHYHKWQREAYQYQLFPWGIRTMTFDLRALQYGSFKILNFELRFKHSDWYRMQHRNLTFDLKKVTHFPVSIVLCFPDNLKAANIPGYSCPKQSGYERHLVEKSDDYDITRVRKLAILQPQWHLCTQQELPEHCHSLTVAKINYKKECNPRYELSATFVPPLVNVFSSCNLQTLIQSLLLLLANTIKTISQQSTAMSLKVQLFHYNLKQYHAAIRLLVQQPVHPFLIYQKWYELNAALEAEEVVYQHEELYSMFDNLYENTRKQLRRLSPLEQQEIPLLLSSEGWWQASFRCHAYWKDNLFLIVLLDSVSLPQREQWISHVKVAPPADCPRLIASALSGIAVQRIDPAALPLTLSKAHDVFHLLPTADQRAAVINEQSIAVFVPGFIQVKKLSLLSLKESL